MDTTKNQQVRITITPTTGEVTVERRTVVPSGKDGGKTPQDGQDTGLRLRREYFERLVKNYPIGSTVRHKKNGNEGKIIGIFLDETRNSRPQFYVNLKDFGVRILNGRHISNYIAVE